jgi:hypothetical protein
MSDTLSLKLKAGSTMTVVGPTQAGKSYLVCQMIKRRNEIFESPFDTIIYCYGENQPLLDDLRESEKDIIFTRSILEADNLVNKSTLLIIDDKLLEASGEMNDVVSRLFIEGSHHRNIFVILILQNLFTKNLRLLTVNTIYLIVMKSPRDLSSIVNLAKQFCPRGSQYLVQAYKRATEKRGGYLVFDFSQTCPDKFRVRNSLFIDSNFEFYIQYDASSEGECKLPQQTRV